MSELAAHCRRMAGRLRLARFRTRVRFVARAAAATVDLHVDPSVHLEGLPEVYVEHGSTNRLVIGPRATLGSLVRLELRGGELTIREDADVRRLCRLNAKGRCEIGPGVLLSTGVHVHCAEKITFEQWSIVGEFSTIADSNHLRTSPDRPVYHSAESAPIRIGRNVWIGAKVTVAKGVDIGDQSFVAANAVVTKNVEPWWLVAGSPAKPVKRLEEQSS